MGKKVLQLVYALESGGIETFVTNLNSCKDVFENPFDYLLFTAEEHEDFYEEVNRKMGSKIYKIGSGCSNNFVIRCIQKRYRVYKVLKKHRYDVVHIHNDSVFCILEAIIAKMTRVPKVIVHSHNTSLGKMNMKNVIKYLFQIFGKPIWRFVADEFCACSTEAGEWMFGKSAVHKNMVHILKNGIDGKKYYYNESIRQIYRKKLSWDNNIIIGHVGRFSIQKNHTFLIDVFEDIYKREKSARLILFGVGEQQSNVEQKIKQKGLDDVVLIFGRTTEVFNWLQALDLFLFPSLYEGLPLVGIEAQAAGIPILASDTISKELEITPLITWQCLNDSTSIWAEKAIEILSQSFKHAETSKEIITNGYDIRTTAMCLYKMYEQ